jgi:hypothetical protein
LKLKRLHEMVVVKNSYPVVHRPALVVFLGSPLRVRATMSSKECKSPGTPAVGNIVAGVV